MKRIHINKLEKGNNKSVITREKYHKISLGNGINCYFKNVKKAEKFLTDTNVMFNSSAQMLNEVFIKTWTAQRRLFLVHHWIFIRDWNNPYIPQIEKAFNLMLTRSHHQNGNYFTFKYFHEIIGLLNEWNDRTCKLLKENHKTYEVEEFKLCKEHTAFIKAKLDIWGKEYQDSAPNCYYDFKSRNNEILDKLPSADRDEVRPRKYKSR